MNHLRATVAVASVVAAGASAALAKPGDIFNANLSSGLVSRYDGNTGAFIGSFGTGLSRPTGITFGPDGMLYVASSGNNQIHKYNPETGQRISIFSSVSALSSPFSIVFGADKNLYVSSAGQNRVVKLSGVNGGFLGFASTGNLSTPIGLNFGPDGRLWVCSSGTDSVVRFNSNGSFHSTFASGPTIDLTTDIAFKGNVAYIAATIPGHIARYDATTGAFIDVFAKLPDGGGPVGIAFDLQGRLIVNDFVKSRLYRVATDGVVSLLSSEGMSGPENVAVQIPGAAGAALFGLAGVVASRRRREPA